MKTIKELQKEKDFIILKASNYHYDLGIQHERERVLGLIDERLFRAFKRLKFCREHKTDYYLHEEMRALSIIEELEELKKRITG